MANNVSITLAGVMNNILASVMNWVSLTISGKTKVSITLDSVMNNTFASVMNCKRMETNGQ